MKNVFPQIFLIALLIFPVVPKNFAQSTATPPADKYKRQEVMIPMRDGIKLNHGDLYTG
jgi:predicted acyl esterase